MEGFLKKTHIQMNMTVWTYMLEVFKHAIVHIMNIFFLNQSHYRRNLCDASSQQVRNNDQKPKSSSAPKALC